MQGPPVDDNNLMLMTYLSLYCSSSDGSKKISHITISNNFPKFLNVILQILKKTFIAYYFLLYPLYEKNIAGRKVIIELSGNNKLPFIMIIQFQCPEFFSSKR